MPPCLLTGGPTQLEFLVDVSNKQDWQKMNEFLIDSAIRMDKAFRKRISQINRN